LTEKIAEYISNALQKKMGLHPKQANETAFHLTDWLEELESFYLTVNECKTLTEQQISDNISNFLIHAPEHIVRASKIVTGLEIENIFDDPEE